MESMVLCIVTILPMTMQPDSALVSVVGKPSLNRSATCGSNQSEQTPDRRDAFE